VVTLVSDFSPGHEAEARFKDRYLASGGEVVESIRVPLQNPDFAPFLQRARDYSPQAIFVFIPSVQAATFAKQFAERGLDKAGIRLIGPGDITDDELLPVTGDAMLGTLTAHFYSAAHPSPMNMAFVDAYRKLTGNRANFMAVSGYDGMHLIYAALRKTIGSVAGDALISAMKGMSWESPRGPMLIDPANGDVVHNIYIRKVERANGEINNVEFAPSRPLRMCGPPRNESVSRDVQRGGFPAAAHVLAKMEPLSKCNESDSGRRRNCGPHPCAQPTPGRNCGPGLRNGPRFGPPGRRYQHTAGGGARTH
jgi:ABC-type branched-subunit amino acid transport system substrate-binding protein